MIIYEVGLDVEHYQYLLTADPRRAGSLDLILDCDRRAETWNPPDVYVGNPKAKRGNFFNLLRGDPIICDQRAYDELSYIFDTCAEILPLPFEDETLYVVNVLKCLNVLDVNRSVWRTKPGQGFPRKYVFHPERMQDAPLFKIPPTSRAQVLTVHDFLDTEYDFKLCVERAGLKGLKFTRLWGSDDGPPT